jgi:hypothetical protein
MSTRPSNALLSLPALTLSLSLFGCPIGDPDPDPIVDPPDEPVATLTCEDCHSDEEMLIDTVEEPEEPDGETEDSGEG